MWPFTTTRSNQYLLTIVLCAATRFAEVAQKHIPITEQNVYTGDASQSFSNLKSFSYSFSSLSNYTGTEHVPAIYKQCEEHAREESQKHIFSSLLCWYIKSPTFLKHWVFWKHPLISRNYCKLITDTVFWLSFHKFHAFRVYITSSGKLKPEYLQLNNIALHIWDFYFFKPENCLNKTAGERFACRPSLKLA